MTDTPDRPATPRIPRDLLLRLEDALALLPNIKPRLARQVLADFGARFFDLIWDDTRADVVREHYTLELLPGVSVSHDDLPSTHPQDGEAPRLTPRQAAVLVQLYEAGAFPLAKPRAGLGDPQALRTYAASEAALLEATAAREAAAAESRAARERLVAAPDDAPASVLTSFGLVNEMFWRHVGPGEGTLRIAGRQVAKTLRRYTSNSGKTSDWAVTFAWTEPDGTPAELTRESRFARNRRHDADRNFGLPE